MSLQAMINFRWTFPAKSNKATLSEETLSDMKIGQWTCKMILSNVVAIVEENVFW